QEFAHPQTTLAMPAEGELALHQSAGLAKKSVDLALVCELLPVALFQFGLVVERVDVADAAKSADVDDPFRLCWKAGRLGRVRRGRRLPGRLGRLRLPLKQPRQRDATQASARFPQETPARNIWRGLWRLRRRIHAADRCRNR